MRGKGTTLQQGVHAVLKNVLISEGRKGEKRVVGCGGEMGSDGGSRVQPPKEQISCFHLSLT